MSGLITVYGDSTNGAITVSLTQPSGGTLYLPGTDIGGTNTDVGTGGPGGIGTGDGGFTTPSDLTITTPAITFPNSSDSEDIASTDTVTSSVFAATGGRTHSASRWQIVLHGTVPLSGAAGVVVYDSGVTAANLTSLPLTVLKMDDASYYAVRVRYKASDAKWSAWSVDQSYKTAGCDANSASVELLCDFNWFPGTVAVANVKDYSGLALVPTTGGTPPDFDASIDAAKQGSSCLWIEAGDSGLAWNRSGWTMASGVNWTLEWDLYIQNAPTGGCEITWAFGTTEAAGRCSFIVDSSRRLMFNVFGSATVTFGAATVALNSRASLAIVRSGNTLYGFINGTLSGSLAYAGTVGNGDPGRIGPSVVVGGGGLVGGARFGKVRFTKGVARWTANYTVDTRPFTCIVHTAPTGVTAAPTPPTVAPPPPPPAPATLPTAPAPAPVGEPQTPIPQIILDAENSNLTYGASILTFNKIISDNGVSFGVMQGGSASVILKIALQNLTTMAGTINVQLTAANTNVIFSPSGATRAIPVPGSSYSYLTVYATLNQLISGLYNITINIGTQSIVLPVTWFVES